MPVIGYLGSQSPDVTADYLRGFRQGLKDSGHIEDQTVVVERTSIKRAAVPSTTSAVMCRR